MKNKHVKRKVRKVEVQKKLKDFKKRSYPQQWSAYNESQTKEKYLFLILLKELCELIEEPKHEVGRKPKLLKDVIYAICLKTYLNTSSRRVQSDLKLSKKSDLIEQDIPFNTLLDHLERSCVTDILKKLIEISALPLKEIEIDFAVDATGFGISRYETFFSIKLQNDRKMRLFRKCHAVCGVITNVITSVETSRGTVSDQVFFQSLVQNTSRNFPIREIMADKGYLSKKHYNLVRDLGAIAYIPFKKDSTGGSKSGGDSYTWRAMFRYFRDHREEFLTKYHKRSNIESCFSMIKRKFGNNLKCKKETSQDNEILAKVLCHNICVLIQEIFISNIKVDFNFRAKEYVARKQD